MKCTNRIKEKIVISFLFCLALSITGCAKQEIPMPYGSEENVSAFRLTSQATLQIAEPFAANLCVTAEDVFKEADIDMSEVGAAGLFDVNNHNVIYAKNIHEKLYPASLTKVMTAIVALKHGNLQDVITVGPEVNITESGAVLCGIKEGDTLTLDQALHALLINSANDAGAVIAQHIGGSEEGFAELMNQEALLLGATNSHFVNPHGLSDDNHYVTAYDMYLIFNEAIKNEYFNEIIHMNNYTTVYHDKDGKEKEFNFHTTNQYLKGTYDAPDKITVMGGKTGTTNAAGNCLVIYAKDSAGNPYISVILRSKEREKLYQQMTDLLEQI